MSLWFNKQDDCLIAEHDKIRLESQTENDGMRKEQSQREACQMPRKQDM